MPIEDELRRLLQGEGIDPRRYAILVHPSDFQRLGTFINNDLLNESLLTNQPEWRTFYGIQVVSSTSVPPGKAFLFRRPPDVFEPSWVTTPADRQHRLPALTLSRNVDRVELRTSEKPKSLWQLLDDAEE